MKGNELSKSPSLSVLFSPVREFMHWWREELVSLLPGALRHQLQHSEHQLLVNFSDNRVSITDCRRGHPEEVITLFPDEKNELNPDESASLSRLLKQRRGNVVVGLEHDHVLSLSFPLPLEAEKNLHEVIGYELGRHAPFKIEQVYFDYTVVERRRADKSIWVSVMLVPRKQIEPKIAILRSWGVVPSAISVVNLQEGENAICRLTEFNLLPPSERADTQSAMNRMVQVLVVSALLLVGVAAAYPFFVQATKIAALQARIDSAKSEAVNVQSMRAELERAAEASAYLEEMKQQYPEVLDVLNTLTELLPDDTWLEHFEMKEKRIRMRGLSADASSLIEFLENSPLLQKVAFDSTIVKDPRLDRFRFQIVAELAERESP